MTTRPESRIGLGEVVALHVCPGPGSRSVMRPLARARALEDRGLEGDRHARPGHHRQVLLVEQEVLDQLGLLPGSIREQVTVRGVRLDDLADGQRLRIGEALFQVGGPCAPCERMNEIRSGLLDALEGRRGRFVRVIQGGAFGVGDPIVSEPDA